MPLSYKPVILTTQTRTSISEKNGPAGCLFPLTRLALSDSHTMIPSAFFHNALRLNNMNTTEKKLDLIRICVIDGQGGGIGSAVIKKLKDLFGETVEIIALGTNAIATAQMLKARANRGASGENAIVQTTKKVNIIIGTVSIILAHSMMGEVTPKIAEAVAGSPAKKLLIPLTQENVEIVGLPSTPLPHLIDALIEEHLKGKIPCVKPTRT